MVNSPVVPCVKTVNVPTQNFSMKNQGSEIRFSFQKAPKCKHISQCASVRSNNAVLPSRAYFIQHRYLYIQQRYEWREMKKRLWYVPDLQFIYEEPDSHSDPLPAINTADMEATETDQELLDNSWSEISMEERKDSADSNRRSSGSFVEIGDEVLPTTEFGKEVRREKKTKVLKYKHLKKKIKKIKSFCK